MLQNLEICYSCTKLEEPLKEKKKSVNAKTIKKRKNTVLLKNRVTLQQPLYKNIYKLRCWEG